MVAARAMLKCASMSRPMTLPRSALVLVAGICAAVWTAGAGQAGSGAAPDAPPDLKAFVGTWKASFHGEVFAILVLREERGSLAGTLNNFDITVDKEGNLSEGT